MTEKQGITFNMRSGDKLTLMLLEDGNYSITINIAGGGMAGTIIDPNTANRISEFICNHELITKAK